MKAPTRPHFRAPNILRALIASCLLSVIGAPLVHSAAANEPPKERIPPEELRVRQGWQVEMAETPPAGKGCFEARYPTRDWKKVTCVPGPNYPMPPRAKSAPRPLNAGGGDDIAAQAPNGHIISAIGSFDAATNVTSESGTVGNAGPAVANAYTLQINTDFFSGTAGCATAAVPANCSAWEQFVYENRDTFGRAFIQYWLIEYSKPCPAGQGWTLTAVAGFPGTSCYKNNSGGTVSVPPQAVTNLGNLSLTGSVSASGDRVTVFDGTTLYYKDGDNAVDAASGWTIAEFNIVGDGGNSTGASQANFNAGAELVTRTRINYGGRSPADCVVRGFTAETSNLGFSATAPTASQPGPAVIFRENTASASLTANCAHAVTVGDTHLQTLGGLFYDFQAAGDFVLAQRDPGFVVQTRQASGAPTWPDASVNKAVATQMGGTQVAVCLEPARLSVDGVEKEIADGAVLSTPTGVDIWRRGNVYTIIGADGDSVRATVNSSYIDVAVGLGRWPAKVTGLIANVDGDMNKIAARDGTVFTNPFAFNDLYGKFGESWRVPAKDSLLNVCSDRKIELRNPARPFFAMDLDRATYDRTRAVCVAAGVKGETFLDACTLDVAVIGADDAAKVFLDTRMPVGQAKVTYTGGHGDGMDSWFSKWWSWLILILIILLLLMLLRKRS
jgi:hypothetical protein